MRRLLIIALLMLGPRWAFAASLYTSGAASSTFLLSSGDPGVVANYLFQDGSGTNLKNNYHGTNAHADGSLAGSAAWVVGSTDSCVGRGQPLTNVKLNGTGGTHIVLDSATLVSMRDITFEIKFRTISAAIDSQLISFGKSDGTKRFDCDMQNKGTSGYVYITDNVTTFQYNFGKARDISQFGYFAIASGTASLNAVLNGVSIMSVSTAAITFGGVAGSAGVNSAWIGEYIGNGNLTVGNIAQVRISARTLSVAEMIGNSKRVTGGGSD